VGAFCSTGVGAFCSTLVLFVLTRLLELCILQRFVRILFELLVQPKVLELCILNQLSRILLEDDDDHTNGVVVDDDDDGGGGGDDDNDPVELFQKRGKWWELIEMLLCEVLVQIFVCNRALGFLVCKALSEFCNRGISVEKWQIPHCRHNDY